MSMPSLRAVDNVIVPKQWRNTGSYFHVVYISSFMLTGVFIMCVYYWLITEQQHFINQWNLWMLANLLPSKL